MSHDALQKINEGVAEALNNIVIGNKELFTKTTEVKEAIEWYKEVEEARKESGQAEAMVTNKVIEKLSEVLPLEFLGITFDKIIVHGKEQKTDIVFNIDLELPPIKPNVYLVILVNGAKLKNNELKISFEVNSAAKLEEVRIFSGSTENYIKVKRMSVHFVLYLLSAMVIGQKKKKIGEMNFRLEDLEFRR